MNESHYPANSLFWLVTPWVDMDCHDKLYIQDHRVCAYGSDRPKLTRLCANFLEVFTINLQCPGIPAPDSRAFVRTTQQVLERVAKRLRQSVCPWHLSNRPEPPFELPGKPTEILPGTAREPVWNLPEPSWELCRNLSETYRNLPGNCTRTCPKPSGTFLGTAQEPFQNIINYSPPKLTRTCRGHYGGINSWFKSSWQPIGQSNATGQRHSKHRI